MEVTYKFNDPMSMTDLATLVQSKVYWGESLYLGDEHIKWSSFWELVADEIENNKATAVIVNDRSYISEVKFLYN